LALMVTSWPVVFINFRIRSVALTPMTSERLRMLIGGSIVALLLRTGPAACRPPTLCAPRRGPRDRRPSSWCSPRSGPRRGPGRRGCAVRWPSRCAWRGDRRGRRRSPGGWRRRPCPCASSSSSTFGGGGARGPAAAAGGRRRPGAAGPRGPVGGPPPGGRGPGPGPAGPGRWPGRSDPTVRSGPAGRRRAELAGLHHRPELFGRIPLLGPLGLDLRARGAGPVGATGLRRGGRRRGDRGQGPPAAGAAPGVAIAPRAVARPVLRRLRRAADRGRGADGRACHLRGPGPRRGDVITAAQGLQRRRGGGVGPQLGLGGVAAARAHAGPSAGAVAVMRRVTRQRAARHRHHHRRAIGPPGRGPAPGTPARRGEARPAGPAGRHRRRGPRPETGRPSARPGAGVRPPPAGPGRWGAAGPRAGRRPARSGEPGRTGRGRGPATRWQSGGWRASPRG
jgi:hypothetical protein